MLEEITIETLNPQTAMAFPAFLPQFNDPTARLPVWAQLMILGGIANPMFALADVVVVPGVRLVLHKD